MVLQGIEKVVRRLFPKRKLYHELTPEEKERYYYQSATHLVLRGYWLSIPHLELDSSGKELLFGLVPETFEKNELEQLLNSLLPSKKEFSMMDIYVALNEGLLSDKPDLSRFSFYKKLTSNLDSVEGRLNQYDLSILTLHALLGSYILEKMGEQGLVTKPTMIKDGSYIYRRC